jgi:hypothetical protein
MDRLPYQSWGPMAYAPEGTPYGQYPDDLWGELSKRAQFVLRALLQILNGRTITDITRAELRKIVNELRAVKGLGPITSLRSITWYLCELVRLGVISRERVDHTNVWYTHFAKPFRARLGVPGAALPGPNDKPGPNSGEVPAPSPEEVTRDRNEAAARAIEAMREKGYSPEMRGDEVVWRPIDGMQHQEVTPDISFYLKFLRSAIRALLSPEPHPRE